MADELHKLEGWIPAMVAANAALVALVGTKVYEGRAPQKTDTFNPFRCIIFALLDAPAMKTMNGTRVMVSARYKIVVAVEGGFTADDYTALNKLTETFEKVDTNTYEGNVFNSRMESLLTLEETDGRTGQVYKQKGAEFTIESYPA